MGSGADKASEREELEIVFSGGLASGGRLLFYEYGRSQYAMARFVAILDHFRRTGEILDRVTQNKYHDIFVEAPDKGSFIETIVLPSVQQGIATVVSLPLSYLLSYLWHLLLPRQDSTEKALLEMARIRLAEEKERTSQEAERTKQIESLTESINESQVSTHLALDLLAWALGSNNVALGRAGLDQRRLAAMDDEIKAEHARLNALEGQEEELSKIDPEKVARLTSRVRPLVPEMALPLRRSADTMSFRPKGGPPVVKVDSQAIQSIGRKEVSDSLVEVSGFVRSFDRATGVGKIILPPDGRVMSFNVPYSKRSLLNDGVLDAMRVRSARLVVREVTDAGGQVTSYILEDIYLGDEYQSA